jgi:hypothetical protein
MNTLRGEVLSLNNRVVALEHYQEQLTTMILPSLEKLINGVIDRVQVNVHQELKPLKKGTAELKVLHKETLAKLVELLEEKNTKP